MFKKIILFFIVIVMFSGGAYCSLEKSTVAIVKVNGDMAKAVAKGLELAGDLSLKINKRDRVILKISVDQPRKDSEGFATGTDVVKEIIKIGRARKARRFTIVEGVTGGDSYKAFDQAGFTKMAQLNRARLKSLDSGRYWRSWVPDGNSYKKYFNSAEVLNCEVFINIPVLKHDKTSSVSLSLKNTLGIVYGKTRKRTLLKANNLDEVIFDINMIRPSDFTIIDGTTVVMPDGKTKKDLGIIIVSSDLVAADAVGAKILGYNPNEIRHLQIAEKKGLGNADLKNIKIVGERIDKFQKLLKK